MHPALLIDLLRNGFVGGISVSLSELLEEFYQLNAEEFGSVDIVNLHVSSTDSLLLIELPGLLVIPILKDILELTLGESLLDSIEQKIAVDTLDQNLPILNRYFRENGSNFLTQESRSKEFLFPGTIFQSSSTINLIRINLISQRFHCREIGDHRIEGKGIQDGFLSRGRIHGLIGIQLIIHHRIDAHSILILKIFDGMSIIFSQVFLIVVICRNHAGIFLLFIQALVFIFNIDRFGFIGRLLQDRFF